jgi:hypothetical protein
MFTVARGGAQGDADPCASGDEKLDIKQIEDITHLKSQTNIH